MAGDAEQKVFIQEKVIPTYDDLLRRVDILEQACEAQIQEFKKIESRNASIRQKEEAKERRAKDAAIEKQVEKNADKRVVGKIEKLGDDYRGVEKEEKTPAEKK